MVRRLKRRFEKDLFKLMNNAIYGKTNENILKRKGFDIIRSKKKAIKRFSQENFETTERHGTISEVCIL